jgi:tRNA A-37 threonylcarbamoyl transferase component Bud32/cytochrome c-type biogenesis protein CcmH/NrfG
MSFNIGENVGQYRIIEQLGQGGMATVYKAYHASLDRYVALKVLHPAFNEDQTFISRFQREARVVAKLEHPNIVPIYDYSEHEKRPYLVMKYIEGDTLKARLAQGPLTSEEIEQVVNSVGAALEYAHRQGILHRDIKPSNVMIATDGMMYLADFGLARIAQAGESTMSSDSIMGTPQYISPEQAMGKKDLDAGTDIYSFGVMLYELVVGQVPFSADTPFSVIHDHIYTPLPLPQKVNPNVPDTVQRVLLKALAKDRLDRYATVEELMDAFKQAWTEAGVPMQGTAIIMRSTMARDRTASKKQVAPAAGVVSPSVKKRFPWMWVGIGLVVLLCLAVIGLAVRNRLNAQNMPPPALTMPPVVQPFQNTPPPGDMGAGEQPQQPPQPQPGGQNDPSGINAARDLTANNPNDPDAHLTLALALWDAQDARAAFEETRQAATLADQNSPDFFIKAGNEFHRRGAWVLASLMYARLVPIYYPDKDMPQDVQTNQHEAAYKSPEQMSLFDPKYFKHSGTPTMPLAVLVDGRMALLNGDIPEAKNQLERVKQIKPDMQEITLLEAEIAMKEGDNEKAKPLLSMLTSNSSTPEWIRIMAENYLKTIQ